MPSTAASQRILIVDDDADERFFTQRALKKILARGATVSVAKSGNDAIAYMIGEGDFSDRKAYPFPTLIITDVNMRDGDGFSLLEFLQANAHWSVVPRVVYSSSDDDDDVRTAYLLGASAYHVKPTIATQIEGVLRGIVEYWATSRLPPVDPAGKLLATPSSGRIGARYPQPESGGTMKRPPSLRDETRS